MGQVWYVATAWTEWWGCRGWLGFGSFGGFESFDEARCLAGVAGPAKVLRIGVLEEVSWTEEVSRVRGMVEMIGTVQVFHILGGQGVLGERAGEFSGDVAGKGSWEQLRLSYIIPGGEGTRTREGG